ncbi:FKBP-type peptidyl-prolyl cis-trans isomerase [Luteimonas aquatica]|uniref:FKBP-type peptidyl-prolyl cis-trans isomerase n=1 Tax=Luteimonas aquatica TaxID=450364 RepID=UPI001F57226D|nr:FKBP-type peptidyl-prolyl cis-trans isomerase [Luteimonas aquatica]
MKSLLRGVAALMAAAAAMSALAQDKTALVSERDKVSYTIGMDVARSFQPAAQDIDLAALERSIRNSLDGGKPLLEENDAMAVGKALMMRIAARSGQPLPGVAPGTPPPELAKDKAGLFLGIEVGRSLQPLKEQIDLPTLMQAVRTRFADGASLLSDADMDTVRKSLSERLQAENAKAGERNAAAGRDFLARNKAVKGVFTTPSGLQYMVLRQGSGKRPLPSDRVRVNYEGTLLDGTVFDSSYKRGEPAEFGLTQVIAGWTEGVAMMPVGAKYRFWIPGNLAYGEKGGPGIAANSTLVFDVELLDIL